jgi:hypothetical protein
MSIASPERMALGGRPSVLARKLIDEAASLQQDQTRIAVYPRDGALFDAIEQDGRHSVCEGFADHPHLCIVAGSQGVAQFRRDMPLDAMAIIPVIAIGTNALEADVYLGTLQPLALENAVNGLMPAISRCGEIPYDTLGTLSPEMRLMLRLVVRDRGLTPYHDAGDRNLVGYEDEGLFPELRKIAAGLHRIGMLERHFFDRTQTCTSCGSARLRVREECTSCRSGHIEETALMHHFKCAHQGIETDFIKGDDLVCPKCRATLRHFGVDYDKPGHMMHCHGCGHLTSEATVGFGCLDCGNAYSAEQIGTRDHFAYNLSERAQLLLIGSTPVTEADGASLDDQDVTVLSFVQRAREQGEEPVGIALTPDQIEQTRGEHGHRMVEKSIDLQVRLLQEHLRASAGLQHARTLRWRNHLLALATNTTAPRLQAIIKNGLETSENLLAIPMQFKLQSISAELLESKLPLAEKPADEVDMKSTEMGCHADHDQRMPTGVSA